MRAALSLLIVASAASASALPCDPSKPESPACVAAAEAIATEAEGHEALLDAAVASGDPAWLPLVLKRWGAGWQDSRTRDSVAGPAMARLVDGLGGGDAAGAVRGVGLDFARQCRARYLDEWGAYLRGLGLQPPPDDATWQGAVESAVQGCLEDPAAIPPDPFHPGDADEGTARRLAEAARCTCWATLQSWRQVGTPRWRELVAHVVENTGAFHDYVDEVLALEAGWGQGRGQPEPRGDRHRWRSPDDVFTWTPARSLAAGLAVALLLAFLGAGAAARSWRRGLFAALALALGFGLVGLLEGLIALSGAPPGDALLPVRPSGLAKSRHDLEADLRFVTWPVPRPQGTVRWAFVGASSVAGVNLVPEDTFSAHLQAALRPELPCLEVVNFGSPGATVDQLTDLARVAQRDFDVQAVLAYTGHNETAMSRIAGALVDPDWLPWQAFATRTHLLGLLTRQLGGPRTEALALELGEGLGLDVRDPKLPRVTTARFERGLEDFVRALQRDGLPVALGVPSWNHHGLRVRSFQLDHHRTTAQRVFAALAAGESAEPEVRQLLETAPERSTAWFVAMLAREAAGDLEGAEAAAWRVARHNARGSALTPGVAAAIARVARRHALPLADAHAALHEASPGHLPGYDLHFDYVHLTGRGAELVAAEYAATLREAGWVERFAEQCP